jgi:ankyrin repeat protein
MTLRIFTITGLACFAYANQEHPFLTAARENNVNALSEWLSHSDNGKHSRAELDAALLLAVRNDHLEASTLLLLAGADPNLEFNGHPLLLLAIDHARPAIVELLMARKADPDGADKAGATALMKAAERGNDAIARALLRAGAKVDTKLPAGDTALVIAIRKAQDSVVELLLAWGADPNGTTSRCSAIAEAISEGNVAIVEAMIRGGATLAGKTDEGGRPALMIAVENGNIDLVKILLLAGAEINARNWDDRRPVTEAVAQGRMDLTEILLAHGADANTTTENGTLLTDAVVSDDEQLVKALLERRADANATDRNGRTPLGLAKAAAASGIVDLLVRAGARE